MEVRLIKASDAELLAKYHQENAEHFAPWEPERSKDYYSKSQLKSRLLSFEKTQDEGKSAYFVGLFKNEIIAHCSLTNIIYGPLQACHMGYGVSEVHEGKGVMTEVCKLSIDYAFNNLGLNRIMAAHMPDNVRSAALLSKLGFSKEGTAKSYLQINGVWEDHIICSLLNPFNQKQL